MDETSPPARPIQEGDIYWVQLDDLHADAPAIPHPYLIIHLGRPEHGANVTILACALTTNPKRASWPGNVLLDAGEGNLPRPSVVEVSKTRTLLPAQLGAYIGALTPQRVEQVLAGQRLLNRSYFTR